MNNLTGAWFGLGGPLQVTLFAVSSWQAYWALSNMAGMAGGGAINAVVTGSIAVSVILARNVIAVRLPTMTWLQRLPAMITIAVCIGFSVITSGLHLAQQIQGGHVASINSSPQYQRADAAYRAAVANLTQVESEIKAASAQGDTASAGHIRSKQLPRAEDRAEFARATLAGIADSGQAGVTATIVTETADHFRMTPTQFAFWLAMIAGALMDCAAVLLAWYDGNRLRSNRPEPKHSGKTQAAAAA